MIILDFWAAVSLAAAVVATITATPTLVTAAAEVCTKDTYTVAKGSAAMYAQYVHRGEGVNVSIKYTIVVPQLFLC